MNRNDDELINVGAEYWEIVILVVVLICVMTYSCSHHQEQIALESDVVEEVGE